MPEITLIISFYNKIECLELIFAALERQTFRNFEVVIADDGSSDSVVAAVDEMASRASFKVRHVWHEDDGWRKNVILNKAVRVANSALLVFIDGDCVPSDTFLEDHYRCALRGEVSTGRRVMLTESVTAKIDKTRVAGGCMNGALFFPLLFDTLFRGKRTKMEQMVRIPYKWMRKLFIKEKNRFILGCNFSLFKDDLLKVNGFDERFVHPGYGEDIDLGNRLNKVGIKTMSRKNLMVIYHLYHKHFFTDTPENLALLEENRHNDPFTSYGYKKRPCPSDI